MKRYLVTLRGDQEQFVDADSYNRDGIQYVFTRNNCDEVQFFLIDEVIGVTIFKDDMESGGTTFISVPLA